MESLRLTLRLTPLWYGLLAYVLCFTTSIESHAVDKRWNNQFGGAFNAAANWTGGIPGPADIAEFGLATLFTPGTYTVTFDVSPTNQAIHVEDDFVTFDLNGRTYTTTLFVGNEIGNMAGSTGKLTITDGIWRVDSVNTQVYVGAVAGATGILTISTAGQLTGSPQVFAGLAGTGTLTLQSGGFAQAAFVSIGQADAAIGTVEVTGPGSTLNSTDLSVGQFGTGTLNITAGGLVQSTFGGVVGNFADATGTAHVVGANSRWFNVGDLTIGNHGEGDMNVTATAQVNNANGYIGRNVGGTGTATIAGGSDWTNFGNLFVGDAGDGELMIEASGNVFNVAATVGNVADTTGMVTVDGPGSDWFSTGDLTIGNNGAGTLNITAGGSVSNDFGRIAEGAGSTGAVVVDGADSIWTNSSSLQVGNLGQASLMITNGGTVSSSSTEIGGVVGITSSATVDGAGSLWTNTGGLEVGDNGDAQLTISNGGVATSGSGALADAPDADALVTVTGTGSTWDMTSGTGILYVGEDGTGTLNILDGGAVSNVEGRVAFDLGSTGTVLVSGAGSTWTNSGGLIVGGEGDAALTVEAGGAVSSSVPGSGIGGRLGSIAGSTGTVVVAGNGAAWTTNNDDLVVGENGMGDLTIEDGGSVSDGDGYIGQQLGGSGVITVTGPSSTWTNSSGLAVGYFGSGALTIANGGSVVNGDFVFVGTFENSSGDVTVTGAGSMWDNGNFVAIGHGGTGALTIEDGGIVSTPRGFIGSSTGSGVATVSGVGSTWTSTEVFVVGFQGSAQLSILGGGSVVSNDAWIAGADTSTATVTVAGDGSNWTIGGGLGISDAFDPEELPGGGTGTLNIQSGATVAVALDTTLVPGATLNLAGGTLHTASVSFNGGGAFNFLSGTLHVGTFGGNLLNQGGTLAPGHSAGATTIAGTYAQQPAAKLEIEIGGTSAGTTYDVVSITSFAGISGQLQLGLLNGFIPGAADTFNVLTTTLGLFGAFSNVANGGRLDTFDDLGSFLVHYGPGSAFNPNQIVLSSFIPNALPGDFNDDGLVDTADFVMWQKLNLGSAAYNTWRQHFGESLGGGSSAENSNAAAPEPNTLAMLMLSVAGSLLIFPTELCQGRLRALI